MSYYCRIFHYFDPSEQLKICLFVIKHINFDLNFLCSIGKVGIISTFLEGLIMLMEKRQSYDKIIVMMFTPLLLSDRRKYEVPQNTTLTQCCFNLDSPS